ncbi:copper resistance protein NlpE [Otariodibacter sp.]|uniref:copper resistance protein NlpE n=1 Tax=Otariodibacter sp. TaxID=3030919 RepID=UPI00263315D4|nr:copper resistance protein NlpE [Otariodibacter sp.]
MNMKTLAVFGITALLSACSLLPEKTVSGTYKGTLPCADCEKIEANIILNNDKTYQYNAVFFKNKEQYPFIEKGTYEWYPEKTDVLKLSDSRNLTLHITDSYIELYDAEGNAPESGLSYKLEKVTLNK